MRHFKKLAVISLFSALAFGSASAQELNSIKDGWYGSAAIGMVSPVDTEFSNGGNTLKGEYSSGIALTGSIGRAFANGFRPEVEFGYARSTAEQVTFNNLSAKFSGDNEINMFFGFANMFYDLKNSSRFTPYLGGGIGFVNLSNPGGNVTLGNLRLTTQSSSETSFAAHGEIGLAYALTERVAIAPSYRYIWVNNGKTENNVTSSDAKAHMFRLATRVAF